MAYNIGAKIGIDGEKQYKDAIRGIIQQSKTLDSEMKAVASGFRAAGDKSSDYEKKTDILNRQIKNQNELISRLKELTEKAASETGENSEVTAKYRQNVYEAEAALGKMEGELSDLDNELDNTGDSTKESGEKFKAFGETLKVVGAAIVAVTTAAAAAAVELGKKVVEAYGEYEQLEGGVKTLFGEESASTVIKYAENAYKTAGLSANQYLDTVTSFSASLISSLGNDTEKAAKYADMAITDMSDNANKMGTDMSSLQSAYSGFAKGQYNMLDNLKLGYGGTKEEMERLIRDAEALDDTFSVTHTKTKKGADEISYSYADVVQAIHIVQNELNITGATAAEADTTIEGSINTLKAAFDNLFIGFGNADADMTTLTNNVTSAFENVVKNITPVIQNIVKALPTVIQTFLASIQGMIPQFLQTAIMIFNQILQTIITLIPQIIPVVMSALTTIVETILANLDTFMDAGLQIILMLLEGIASGDIIGQAVTIISQLTDSISQNLPKIIDAGITLILSLIDGILEPGNLTSLIQSGITLIMSLINGLIGAIPQIVGAIPQIVSSLLNAILSNLPLLIQSGIDLMVALTVGLIEAIPQIVEALPEIFQSIIEAFKNVDWASVGTNIMEGIRSGLNSMINSLVKSAKEIGGKILEGAKNVLGIASPSKVFRDEVGKMIPRGLEQGINKGMPSAIRDMEKQMDNLVIGASATIDGVNSVAPIGSNIANNYGGFTINVSARDGQSANDIANEVMYRIQNAVNRREAVFA